MQGEVRLMQGDKEGITQIRQGIAAREATGARTRPAFYVQMAEAYRIIGKGEEGLNIVVRGLAVSDETGERSHDAELNRLKGQILLQQSLDNATDAESCFQTAISIAQHQSAKSWELRAATSLAKLWQSQGKRDEARELLEPVCSWFTESHDTADLKDAKALLDELS